MREDLWANPNRYAVKRKRIGKKKPKEKEKSRSQERA